MFAGISSHSEDHCTHSTRSGKQSEITQSSHPEGVHAVNPRRLEFVDSRHLTFFDKKTVITTFGKHWNCYCGNKHLVCVLYFLMRMGGRCSLVRWGFVALCRILGSRTRSRTRWCGLHQMVRDSGQTRLFTVNMVAWLLGCRNSIYTLEIVVPF